MVENIKHHFKMISRLIDKFIWLIPFLIIIIGFNGLLNPFQLRAFGDSFPRILNESANQSYEYFFQNFNEARTPFNNTPFRYHIEAVAYFLATNYSPRLSQWIIVFLPLLLSFYLSFWFFKRLSNSNSIALSTWFIWTFSTFVLYTSSIHTHIIITINIALFYTALIHWFVSKDRDWTETVFFSINTSFVALVFLIYEMRMFLIASPYFLFIWIYFIFEYLKKSNPNFKIRLKQIIFSASVNILTSLLYFSYIALNLRSVFSQVESLVSRGTWGNQYFQFINVLSIHHPFWNIPSPEIFVYHFPSLIYLLNVISLVLILYFSYLFFLKENFSKFKKIKIFGLLVLTLFFGFLSKQNNFPFENIYDYLYSLPYFSFSREASKYYYTYLLSILTLLLFVSTANLKHRLIKQLIQIAIILMLVPSIFNFGLFATRLYGKTIAEYKYNSQSYSNINTYLDARTGPNETSTVLWLPSKNNLQNNTDFIKHISYFNIASNYPLNNIRKSDRDYLFNSLTDLNFKKYLYLLNVDFVIFPNIDNDRANFEEMKILYPEYDPLKLKEFAVKNLNLNFNSAIDGYEIYEFNYPEGEFSIVETEKNYKQTDVGQIVLKNKPDDEVKEFDFMKIDEGVQIREGNCNSNESKGLNFRPSQRINIQKNSGQIKLEMTAKYEEIPCVFFELENLNNDSYLKLDKYNGDPIELISFDEQYPKVINIKKIFNLDKFSKGYVPISCGQAKCNYAIYLYGDKPTLSKLLTFEAFIVSGDLNKFERTITPKVKIVNTPINSLYGSEIKIENFVDTDYLLIPYNYDSSFVLTNSKGLEINPEPNNHNMLLFDVRKLNIDINTDKIKLYYPKEQAIQKDLDRSLYVLIIFIFITIITNLTYLYLRRSKKLTALPHLK